MKQFLLHSLLLWSLLMGLVACSSDDAEIMGPALTDVNSDYQHGATGKTLELYYGGSILSGSNKTVTFHSEDKQKAVITIKNVIPGVDVLELSEVLLISSKDQTQYSFSGVVRKTDCTIDYDGAVEKGKMSLNLSAKLVANNDVVGQWILQKIQTEGEVYKKQPIFFTWHTTDEFPGFKIKTSEGFPLTISCTEASRNIGEGLSNSMASTEQIRELTLSADGNLIVLYKISGSDTTWQKSDLNALQYYIRDGRFYLLLNEKMLNSSADDDALMGIIKSLLQQYGNGIPFGLHSAESGKLSLYLDAEVLGSTKLVSLAPVFKNFLPTQSTYYSVSLLQNVFDNYAAAIKATTDIQLGLNFNLVKQGSN